MNPRASDRIAATRRAPLVALSATGKSVSILKGVSEVESHGVEEVVAEFVQVVAEDRADRDDGCRRERLAQEGQADGGVGIGVEVGGSPGGKGVTQRTTFEFEKRFLDDHQCTAT